MSRAAALVVACAAFVAAPRHDGETVKIAGLECSVWRPAGTQGRAPLVIFSHGFHGNRNQSTFLTAGLARAGYFVVAPNHKDAKGRGASASAMRPDAPFGQADKWNDTTYKDRANDITALLAALKNDPAFSSAIDWSRVALAGHSLGGYTVLGLAGAWPSWKLPDVKAVLALSPVASPYVRHGDLPHLACPVMYQTGTADLGIAPFLRRAGGAWEQTRGPAYLVDFQGAAHFAWTDLNPTFQSAIVDYSVAFLNRHVKGDARADPTKRQAGVAELQIK